MILQDRGGNDTAYLAEQLQKFVKAAGERPEIGRASSLFRASVPQVFLDIDDAKVLKLGVPLQEVNTAIGAFVGAGRVRRAADWYPARVLPCRVRRGLSRVHGSRVSLAVGVLSVSLLVLIGVMLGSISGYFGGLLDLVLMRVVEVIHSVPTILLLVTMLAVIAPSGWGAVVAMMVVRS